MTTGSEREQLAYYGFTCVTGLHDGCGSVIEPLPYYLGGQIVFSDRTILVLPDEVWVGDRWEIRSDRAQEFLEFLMELGITRTSHGAPFGCPKSYCIGILQEDLNARKQDPEHRPQAA